MDIKPKFRFVFFISVLIIGVITLIIPMADSTLISGVVTDISDPSGMQYLAFLPIILLLAIVSAYLLSFPIQYFLPPLVINIRHRRKHPNTSSGIREFLIPRNKVGKKYHHRLLSESEPTQKEKEH